ncbi:MAG: dihydroorotase [Saprospiraceae bacterium]|nr:dihydroorotase [Saprospiraceae bacterium]
MQNQKKIIKGALVINEGEAAYKDVLIVNERIESIAPIINIKGIHDEIDATGLWLIPGIIDDQVHFREPGLTHKANVASESKAAVAGGTTTFMEMPNTKPECLTQELLAAKYEIGRTTSYANYSFFMGVSNENYDEVMKTDPKNVCGVKIFMGSSTGNMLVDNPNILDKLFANVPMLIATHCEDENTIKTHYDSYKNKYGEENLQPYMHPLIRDAAGCYLSSSFAVELAQKHGTRLHILHISTAKELDLFRNDIPLSSKKITSEVCVHHMYFSNGDYVHKGNLIKCNPAIKTEADRDALMVALLDDRLDIVATDHAPHTWDEKQQSYAKAPSGLPFVQHSLNIMLDFYHQGKISKEKIVEKMCHAPAECFKVEDRGYLREGMYADMVLIDPKAIWTVKKENIHYKCGWSPLEGKTFKGKVIATFVNGTKVYNGHNGFKPLMGKRLTFLR